MAEKLKANEVRWTTYQGNGTVRLVLEDSSSHVDVTLAPDGMRNLGLQLICAAYEAEKKNG